MSTSRRSFVRITDGGRRFEDDLRRPSASDFG
jgi:hypothetical protein